MGEPEDYMSRVLWAAQSIQRGDSYIFTGLLKQPKFTKAHNLMKIGPSGARAEPKVELKLDIIPESSDDDSDVAVTSPTSVALTLSPFVNNQG